MRGAALHSHFPIWFIMPSGLAHGRERSTVLPIAFSSAEKMAQWLKSRIGENHWYVRLLDRDALGDVLHDLVIRGYTQVYVDLGDAMEPGTMPISDLVLKLNGNRQLQNTES